MKNLDSIFQVFQKAARGLLFCLFVASLGFGYGVECNEEKFKESCDLAGAILIDKKVYECGEKQ